MFNKLLLIPFLGIFLLFFPTIANAQIVINEFSSATSDDDWVEIYNTTTSYVDLSTYVLQDVAGNTKGFSCILAPNGFNVVPWSNRLNLAGDTVKLLNGTTVVNCVAYGDGARQKCEDKENVDIDGLGSGEFGTRSVDGSGSWIKSAVNTKDGPNDGGSKNPNAICSVPTPTPTPIPTPTPTPTPIPTKTPTPTPTKPPTPKPSPKEEVVFESQTSNNDQILGLREQLKTQEPEEKEEGSKKKFPILPVILIIVGVGFMGFAGYTSFKKMKSEGYNNQNEENI